MTDKVEIYADEGVEVTDEMRALTEKGISSLREWLTQRKEAGYFNEENTSDSYEDAMKRLDNVKVYFVGKDGKCFMDAIERGDLHIHERRLKRQGMEGCKEAVQKAVLNEDAQGAVISGYIEEPAIVVNMDVFKKSGDLTLDSLIHHEGTHTLGFYSSEGSARQTVKRDVNPGVSYDMFYKDSGEEVYARLMQLRYHLKLDPNKTYTVEDVAKLREECLKVKNEKVSVTSAFDGMKSGKSYSMDDLRALMKKNQESHAEENANRQMQLFNYHAIFERYSDEQIMHLLNETADLGPHKMNDAERQDFKLGLQCDFELAQAKTRMTERMTPTNDGATEEQPKTARQTEMTDVMVNKMLSDRKLC